MYHLVHYNAIRIENKNESASLYSTLKLRGDEEGLME
jgi:hypothetical protein